MCRPLVTFVCGTLFLVAAHGGVDDGAGPGSKVLTVCAIPGSMPRMGKSADGKPEGLDIAVAERLAGILKRPIEFHWCASAESAWHCLPEGRCDVVLGQPYDSGPQHEVAWSVPYAEARFGLVVPQNSRAVGSLGDLGDKRVGIVADSVAISDKDHAVVRFKTREELLDGFRAAALEAAFLTRCASEATCVGYTATNWPRSKR